MSAASPPTHATEVAPPETLNLEASAGRYFLAPIAQLLADHEISEVMVNGPNDVFFERAGRLHRSELTFPDERALLSAASFIAQQAGRPFDELHPIVDARLHDGSRVCVVRPPISTIGTSISIRRFHTKALDPKFLIENNTITPEALDFLLLAVASHQNVVVSGGTGSGKTTLLNILSTAIAENERVVVVEDTTELQLQHENVVQMQTRSADVLGRGAVSLRDLFVTSLRLRPDRIIVGEIRRGEAVEMLQAMTSGHRGSLATLHANTPLDACRRLETMALMSDLAIPLIALRGQIASALDLVVQVNRLPNGARAVTAISEVGFDDTAGHYRIRDVFAPRANSADLVLEPKCDRPLLFDDPMAAHLLGEYSSVCDMFGISS